jgi:DNA (cytosine-5)-methyltransferase 1
VAATDEPRIASLCSGFGGLDDAVLEAYGGRLAWYCQYDPEDRHQYAAQIIARHAPGVPNLGDITTVDYTQVEPVDILTAGWPCQDMSLAGKRAGLIEGTRSGLWFHVARAIKSIRPSLVILENVRGLLSAPADSDVEPCPWCLGDAGDGEPAMRALGVVLADLAELGFDAERQGIPASDVGACHQRFRIFVLAWPADPESAGRTREGLPGRTAEHSPAAADADDLGGDGRPARAGQAGREVPAGDAAADADGGRLQGHPQRDRRPVEGQPEGERRLDAVGSGPCGSTAADASGERYGDAGAPGIGGLPAAALAGRAAAPANANGNAVRKQPVADDGGSREAVAGLAGPDAPADASGVAGCLDDGDSATAPDAEGDGWLERRPDAAVGGEPDWGQYADAITRWETVLGRPAPGPVDDRGRLNPVFVEWMQGLGEGHVTGLPGIPRTAQLKALGNGVVPQQAAAAIRLLHARMTATPTLTKESG